MRTIYNILFNLFFALSAPFYFWKMWRRGNWRSNFQQRFGKYDGKLKQALTNRHILWMHAVSVGEVNLCTQLIRTLETELPNMKIVVSTTTTTGMGELNKHLPSQITRIYYPIDRRKHVQRAMGTIHPEAVVLIEAEIWPNFLWSLQRRRIPYFLVNARLSNRSFRGYRRFGFLFRPLFAGFAGVSAQNEEDAARLRELGVRPEVIEVVGSLKYDAAKVDERRVLDVPLMLNQVGAPQNPILIVGGSTHSGEELILAEIVRRLRPAIPKLFLVIVPRHQERGNEVGRELTAKGFRPLFRTEITPSTRKEPGEIDCLIINTTGELRYFYQHADIVFVGKSLTAEGGQNPIEPAALGKAVIFGPHMSNFAQIVPEFLKHKGALQVENAAELESAIASLAQDPKRRSQLGQQALHVVEANRGSLHRTVDMIVNAMPEEYH